MGALRAMSTPTFETKRDSRGVLVICTIDGEMGAARVFSSGEADARARAEAQARAKVENKNGAA